ncbi:MAG: hypothetical protein ACON37_03860 [Candidatus Puniceispirillaceae bacterium]
MSMHAGWKQVNRVAVTKGNIISGFNSKWLLNAHQRHKSGQKIRRIRTGSPDPPDV